MSAEAVYGASPVKRKRRTDAELADIDAAIITAVAQDHPMTLRGVYYRVVSAGAVEKTEDAYNLVGRQLLKLRRTGRVPYSWITDGTRWITKPETWSKLDEMLEDAGASYRRALWHDHDVELMVFTEKDAISGILLPVTEKWDVPLGVLRGYSSETFCYGVADDIFDCWRRDKMVFVYQFGNAPQLVQDWTSDRASIRARLASLRPMGSTAMYDAVAESVALAQAGAHVKKALVVIVATASRQLASRLPARARRRCSRSRTAAPRPGRSRRSAPDGSDAVGPQHRDPDPGCRRQHSR